MEIVELTKSNMLSYAGAVNQSRAIPDARTGLKPIHRKILYEMYADKIGSKSKYKKCAYMVGQIIARFSEHGDAATYDALVRLSQPWIQRYPLLDFHGNSGSQFGDPSAAMRYTEARLSKMAEEGFLNGLEKNNIDWIPNFTNEEQEPSTLPALFPGLFCLPNQGIGYACACNFLTMNLSEVCDGLINFINNGIFPVMQYDLASGGTIINPEVMDKIYETGRGAVIVESKYAIKKQSIYITEIPFNVMFDNLMEEIIRLCEKEEINFISDIKNNSGNGKLELIIDIKKGFNPKEAIDILFEKTKLRSSYGINQVALVGNKPKLLTQPQMAEIYVNHNLECILKEFKNDYETTMNRVEILEGLSKALSSIDKIISLIRESDNTNVAKEKLISDFSFTERQSKAILDMRLAKLSKLDAVEINDELSEKVKFSEYCKKVIDSEEERKKILIDKLRTMKNDFGDERRTQVIKKEIAKSSKNGKDMEQKVEKCLISFNPLGYIQRLPVVKDNNDEYKTFETTTNELILLFSNLGNLYRVAVKDIKKCGTKDKGTPVGSVLKLKPTEKIMNIFSNKASLEKQYILLIESDGNVKKINFSDFTSTVRNLKGMKILNSKAILLGVSSIDDEDVILYTENNLKIRFSSNDIRVTNKGTRGLKGITLQDGDSVISYKVVDKNYKSNVTRQKMGGKGKKQ